jgi:hypothetical protein
MFQHQGTDRVVIRRSTRVLREWRDIGPAGCNSAVRFVLFYPAYMRLIQVGVRRYITKVLGMTAVNFKDETITDMFVVSYSEPFTSCSPLL